MSKRAVPGLSAWTQRLALDRHSAKTAIAISIALELAVWAPFAQKVKDVDSSIFFDLKGCPRTQDKAHTQGMQNDESQSDQSIHNLVYCSQAAQAMDKDALEKIIAAAKRHNPRFGITGLLVFGSGIFFQWLEGPKDNVTSLLQMISADPRHSNVVILTQEDEIRDRLFPNWDMELVQAADIKVVLEDALEVASNPKQKKALSNMLQALHQSAVG